MENMKYIGMVGQLLFIDIKNMSLRIYYDVNGRNGERFEIRGDLSKLKSGKGIFSSIGYITDFSYDLPLLEKAPLMFNKCYNLTTFTSNLSSLTKGTEMFNWCSNLTTFNANLNSLSDGRKMFNWCSNLTTFNANLSSLTKGGDMFYYCKMLSSFTSDLRSLTDGEYMFLACTNLSSFTSDLRSLTNGEYMFSGCTNLSSFTSDLRSLTNGNRMFKECKLNASSVENIASSINTYDGGEITIHVDDTLSETDKNTILSHFTTIEGKGWTVDSNLSTTAALSEDGEPIEDTSVFVKLEEANEHIVTHIDKDGNKVILRNAKYVGGQRQNEWTLFASLEGAEQFFGLTRIVDELNNNT